MSLKPMFTIACGAFNSTSANPTAGPKSIIVRRDMDTPADALEIHFSHKPSMSLGREITVKLGYDGTEELVFTGDVTAIIPGIVGVTAQALGKMNNLLNLRTAMTFEKKTAGNIARSLIGDAGATAGTLTAGSSFPRYAVDKRMSAYAHLKQLANRLGFELYTTAQGKVMFHAPSAGMASKNFEYGKHLLNAAVDQQPAVWKKITVGAESPVSQKGDKTAHWLTTNDKDYRSTAGSGTPELLLIDPAARTTDMAKDFATGYLTTAGRRATQISLTVPGAPEIDLGDVIGVKGVPENFADDSGYVSAIHHEFNTETGFTTSLTLSVKASGGGL